MPCVATRRVPVEYIRQGLMRVWSCRSEDDGSFSLAAVCEPYFNPIDRQFAHCSFSPFDGDDGSSIEILLQAEMRHGLHRFKSVQIGMRQRKSATIFMDQDKRGATDATRRGA